MDRGRYGGVRTAVVAVAFLLTFGSIFAADSLAGNHDYDFPAEKKPGIDVMDDLYREVASVRIGRTYQVIPDLGAGTYSDPEITYVCLKTGPSGRFKCELAWATNLYTAAYPEGQSVTVSRKHVFGGRVWIRVLDTVTKRIIFKRSMPVR